MDKPKVLIVEDEVIIAMSIKRDLVRSGYDVCGIAKSGTRAIEIAENATPTLALMDIKIQGKMDGVDTALALERIYQLPVIYITGNTEALTLERALSTKNHGLLHKPFKMSLLEQLIDAAAVDALGSDKNSILDPNDTKEFERRRSTRMSPNPIEPEKIYIVDPRGYSIPALVDNICANGVGILHDNSLSLEDSYTIEFKLPPNNVSVKGIGIVKNVINYGELNYYGLDLVFDEENRSTFYNYILYRRRQAPTNSH